MAQRLTDSYQLIIGLVSASDGYASLYVKTSFSIGAWISASLDKHFLPYLIFAHEGLAINKDCKRHARLSRKL